jgi:hypothetical protein
VPQQRTVFPADVLPFSLPTALYALSRSEVAGVKLWRLVQWLFLVAAAVWTVGLPGRLWGGAGVVLALFVLQGLLVRERRRGFVRFVPAPTPAVTPRALTPSEKIPVFVTGRFQVERKHQRFTWLPGFYRTFATREHALLCQVADGPVPGIGRWPEGEAGLWYIFFTPAAVQSITYGTLRFGRRTLPALALTHRPPTDEEPPKRSSRPLVETVYLAFADSAQGQQILADLRYDRPDVGQSAPQRTHPATP